MRIKVSNQKVVLSIIIPTTDADRNGYFLKLLKQIESQTFRDYELIIIRGDPRQGRAINIGASLAQGTYIMTLDDDTALPDPETSRKLVEIMGENPVIGIAGGNNIIPEDASPLVRRVMKEVPRRSWEPVKYITDSDLAEHPCMIMRTLDFRMIGGENELIPRGLDPYLREQFRNIGKRVVVVPGVVYHHLPPNTLTGLLKQFYRNGRLSSFTNRYYPQWAIETPDTHGAFKPHVSLSYRLLRYPIRLLKAIIGAKFTLFSCELSYALGFIHETINAANRTEADKIQ